MIDSAFYNLKLLPKFSELCCKLSSLLFVKMFPFLNCWFLTVFSDASGSVFVNI